MFMKSSRISLLAAALVLMCSCASMRETPVESSSLPHYKWTKIADGMDYTQIAGDIFKSNQCISAVRYRTAKYRTDVVSATGKEAMTTSGFGQKYNALAAINGSYFNVSKLTPVTYIKEDGTQLGYTTAGEMIRTDGMAMFDGCSIAINLSDTSRYTSLAASYEDALASGPVLITNGKVRTDWPSTSFFTGRHPRTVFGTDGKGYAYLIVIDGRFPDHGIGTTIPETAEVARCLGLVDAINLDGGGSSAVWTAELGVLSHPYDNKTWDHTGERIVPNALVVRKKQ